MTQIVPDELAQLVRQYSDALVVYARQWSDNGEDCVQEAFIELAKTQRPDHPVAWLFRVTRNIAINSVRSETRRSRHEQLAGLNKSADLAWHESLDRAETQQLLINAIEQLSGLQRELVMLRIWGDLTWQEIGEVTSLSSSTAQRKYVAALEQLKSCLHQEVMDHE